MADSDRTRRFRRTRAHKGGDAAAFIDALRFDGHPIPHRFAGNVERPDVRLS